MHLDALLASFSLVTLAEMGDKTQLLSILLAARFRCFWPLLGGIFIATLLNHALAAELGRWLADALSGHWVQTGTSLLFILIGFWTFIPDNAPAESTPRHGAFLTSLCAFFIAEMGDKTQLATVTLGADYAATGMVILGTTLGMLAANIPALLLGSKLLQAVPLNRVRIAAGLCFIAFGLWGLASL